MRFFSVVVNGGAVKVSRFVTVFGEADRVWCRSGTASTAVLSTHTRHDAGFRTHRQDSSKGQTRGTAAAVGQTKLTAGGGAVHSTGQARRHEHILRIYFTEY